MITTILFLLFALLCIALSAERTWESETEPVRNRVVFAGRNRAYGAFRLRQDYDRRLVKALLVGVLSFSLAAAVPKALGALGIWSAPMAAPHHYTVVDMTPPPYIEVPKTAEAPRPPAPKRAAPVVPITPVDPTSPVIPSDSLVPPDPVDPKPVTDPGPAPVDPGAKGGVGSDPTPGSGTGTGGSVLGTAVNPRSMGEVARLPEFIGGHEAMVRFVQNNIRFPAMDNARQKEWVEFVVDADGTVIRVRAKGRASRAFSEAAERVVRAMPKWRPAEMENGDRTACLLVLPIDFQTR